MILSLIFVLVLGLICGAWPQMKTPLLRNIFANYIESAKDYSLVLMAGDNR